MSKQVEVTITCPSCRTNFKTTLYRTIWGEYPENRALVMSDEINIATCSSCRQRFKIPMPFMYTNADKNFAVWWEPRHDPQIDNDTNVYKQTTGSDSYFSTAPRIADWNDFKETIKKFEAGILKGKAPQKMDMKSMIQQMIKNKK